MALTVYPHPVLPAGQQTVVAAFLPSETLGAYLERHGVALRGEVYVLHNGYMVPHHLWTRLVPRTGDSIIIRARMQGDGGGGKVLRTVAMVALMVAAVATQQWYLVNGAGMLGMSAATTASLIGAGIMLGGSLLISALLPVPTPAALEMDQGGRYETSPTYSLTGGRNRMRPWEPMTLIFGRHKVIPDLGAKYYRERVGDTMFLNQVFHFGVQAGEVDLSDFRIGQTPITNYPGVQIQISGADGALSMFPGNVDTLEGFLLPWQVVNTRTTPLDVTYISVDLAANLYNIADDASIGEMTVDLRIQYRKVGDPTWIDIGLMQDAIYATHYWSLIEVYYTPNGDGLPPMYNERQVQFGSANAGDHVDGDEVVIEPGYWGGLYGDIWYPERKATWRWRTHPYQQGRPWYGIAPDPVIGYSSTPGVRMYGARREVTYQSVKWAVARGQYEVRIWKTSDDINDGRTSNEVAVEQILCFQADDADYTGQLRVALRIQATAQINGSVDEFSALAQAKTGAWTGSNFEFGQTRNPAWWFLAFAIGKKIGGVRVWGKGLAEHEIDIERIKAWGAWCDAKGLTFDYVLDQQMDNDAMLRIIARAGRASPTQQTGKLGVVYDAENLPVQHIFTPYNIRAGSFRVEYASSDPSIPDGLVANFMNEETWTTDEIRVQVPGATTQDRIETIDLQGITKKAIAAKELNLIAASQVFHRRRVSWEADWEGLQAYRGDVVGFSHDLLAWSYSGRLLARSGNQITLVEPLPTGSGTMLIREPSGRMKTVTVTGPAEETDTVTITTDLSGGEDEDPFPLPGDEGYEDVPPMDWLVQFDPLETPGRRLKIIDVKPTQNEGVKFIAIDDDPEYYACENNPYEHTPRRDGALLAGVVFAITFTEGWYNTLSRTLDLVVGWSLSVDVPADVVVTINGVTQAAQRVDGRSLKLTGLRRGDELRVSVTPASLSGRGKPLAQDYTVVAAAVAPSALAQITATPEGNLLRLRWSVAPEPDVIDYEVRDTDSNWGASGALFVGDATTCTVDPDLGTYYVRSVNAEGLYSTASASVTFTPGEVPDVATISEKFQDTSLTNATITLSWPGVTPQFGLRSYRIDYNGITVETDSTTITLPADWIGDRTFKVQTIDGRGVVSTGTQKTITKLRPSPVVFDHVEVIDNNAMLYWRMPSETTLPLDHATVKRGADWASGERIGDIAGEVLNVFETTPGVKTYWIAAVDTDGWESDPISVQVTVDQPPDFILRGDLSAQWDGVYTNALMRDGAVLLPVDTTETWQSHFTSRSWAGPYEQIAAGYPLYLQPTPNSGSYVEVFDFEQILPSSRISFTVDIQKIVGNPNIVYEIETSTDNANWTSFGNTLQAFTTNFRYVRFTVTVTQSGDTDLARIQQINVVLSSKLKDDAGRVTANSGDALGTIVNFEAEFLDVTAIMLTPEGTAPRMHAADFTDAVTPGTWSISGGVVTVTIAGHGWITGQNIRLGYLTRDSEVVTITGATTNTFTAATTGADGSGSLLAYPQSMRVYLFDKDGVRVTGPVSWTVKGN